MHFSNQAGLNCVYLVYNVWKNTCEDVGGVMTDLVVLCAVGQTSDGGGRAGPPLPGRGAHAVPLVHVQVLHDARERRQAVHGGFRDDGAAALRRHLGAEAHVRATS